jgi:hypothetical protein
MGHTQQCGLFVQDTGTAVTNVSVPITAVTTVGHKLMLGVQCSGGTAGSTFSATDTKGNTWTPHGIDDTNVTNNRVGVLTCTVTTAHTTSDHITLSISSGTRATWVVIVDEFDDATTFDVGAVADGISAAPACGPTGTAAQNNQLLYMALGWSGVFTFSTLPAGWSAGAVQNAPTAQRSLHTMWAYVNAPGTRSSGAAALSSSTAWAAVLAALDSTHAPPATRYLKNGSGVWVPMVTNIM